MDRDDEDAALLGRAAMLARVRTDMRLLLLPEVAFHARAERTDGVSC